ncbi:hypothetical protein J7M22_15995 [Candidatus Poribacteria bacterium]|nr:hypothetical protein [Candidatus Poribacteria bacterium]
MKYLGIAKKEAGQIIIDTAGKLGEGDYEVIEIGEDILLIPAPLDRRRLAYIEKLADISIDEHRQTLERLAK